VDRLIKAGAKLLSPHRCAGLGRRSEAAFSPPEGNVIVVARPVALAAAT
jgi:hypothetical protein